MKGPAASLKKSDLGKKKASQMLVSRSDHLFAIPQPKPSLHTIDGAPKVEYSYLGMPDAVVMWIRSFRWPFIGFSYVHFNLPIYVAAMPPFPSRSVLQG